MNRERTFLREDGIASTKCKKYYYQIKNYAEENNLKYTSQALELAIDLHEGQFRDGGEPYIVHPLEIAVYLILLNLHNVIYDLGISLFSDEVVAEEYSIKMMDILLASTLLHDTREDCRKKLINPEYKDRIHSLPSEIWRHVNVVTKDKEDPEFSDENYFKGIKDWIDILIKIGDKISNCSTIDVFGADRMKKYAKEVYDYFYPLIRLGKNSFPDFSRHFTIMKSFLVSISETVAAVQGMPEIIQEQVPSKTLNFIKGFATGKGCMPNTLKAIACANEIYSGLKRKSGDDFIIHPLRVCSYLISLKIDNDEICAAALVHEAIKKCKMRDNAIELVTKWHLSPTVRDYVMIMASNNRYSLKLYYALLMENPEVFLLKLANRVNTCTNLINMPIEEELAYIDECERFIFPSSEFVIKEHPEYSYAIRLMIFHINSQCNVTQNLLAKKDKK